MSDQTQNPVNPTPAAGQPAVPAPTPAPPNAQKFDSVDDLPPFWRDTVKDLRSEGQNKGARITSLESELGTVRGELATKEAALSQQVADATLALARYRAAVNAGIPVDQADDFASRLRGTTVEEIAADAQSLAGLVQTNAPAPTDTSRRGVDPSQGAGNGSTAAVTVADQLQSQIRQLLGR